MQEKQLLENIEKKIWDVNVLAIFLVEDHPGNKYVSPTVEEGLRGAYIPILLDILPIRAYWILEKKWGINKKEAALAILDFLKKYDTPQFVPIRKEMILEAFKLSKELKHDVYDCIYLALAKQEKASTIITTDTDFEKLCQRTGLKYENPVPLEILKQFQCYK
ncbi:MAG: type II toxin-antitoxin system VapC family toxin [Thermoprotei archaeon]|nr:type II toxin-antitoxin system VapC family toxin [Thermoprotei archaeon]